jgi:dTDP-4-amino-4,6-dideoxygalactose transaminase
MNVTDTLFDRQTVKREIAAAIQQVIDREDFILGEEVSRFEDEAAAYLGVKHAVGLNSGTDAFRIALAAIGVKPGDEVILPPFCFISDAAAVALEGGTPVFADIDPVTCNLDVRRVEEKITPRTRAVIPAHMYGVPVDLDPLLELVRAHGIVLIEDACQAFGATYRGQKAGSFGDFAGFSFYPTKPIGCYGDAGLVVTGSDEYAERIKMVRNHGSRKRYYHDFIGFSSRLDTIQAAVLRVELKYFEQRLERLEVLKALYDRELAAVDGIALPVRRAHIREGYTHYTIRTSRRDALAEHLRGQGIQCGIYYPLCIHLQKAFAHLGHAAGDFPESERAQAEVLSLPFSAASGEEEILRVAGAVRAFFG